MLGDYWNWAKERYTGPRTHLQAGDYVRIDEHYVAYRVPTQNGANGVVWFNIDSGNVGWAKIEPDILQLVRAA